MGNPSIFLPDVTTDEMKNIVLSLIKWSCWLELHDSTMLKMIGIFY